MMLFEASCYLGGSANQPDIAGIELTFTNFSGVVFGHEQIGPVSSMDLGNQTGMMHLSLIEVVPPGTRIIEFGLRMEGVGGYIDAFADGLSLKLLQGGQ